ncbi:MAG TPA: hypothetical protein VG273_16510 [Bryobacteraceae bacterium]|jgi:hypothetical protein|nr:hypothetical protein [Bryobacteraceae bacterium]
MSLFAGNTPKPTRFRLLRVDPRGTLGQGHEPAVGAGADIPLVVHVPSTQTVDCFDISTAADALLFGIDLSGNVTQSGVVTAKQFVVQVAVTSAQLKAMFAAPVSLMAAPGAGIGIVIDQILFEMKRTATAYASGGTLQFQYHTAATVVHQGTIPASRLTTAGAANTLDALLAGTPTNSNVIAINDGIDITNNTGAFTTGTGTAIVTIFGTYLTLG